MAATSGIANSTVPQRLDRAVARPEALPVADRAGGAVAGVHRHRDVDADRLGRVVLDRPDRDPGGRPGDRPDRRPRPLQPARRRDRGAGEGPVLPVDHLPLPADPVRRLRRRDVLVAHGDLSALDKIGIAISIGCIGGIGINTAHELGHKKEANERWLSKIALAQSFYGHFYIEHNRGHHVRVATPEDPASARVGESFYQFWPRTVGGSLRSAWNLEKRRIARRKQHPWRLSNDVLNAWLMSAVLWGAMIAVFGVGIAPYLVIQAVVGLLAARGRQLHGALRDAAAEGRRRRAAALRAGRPLALVELQQHRDQRAALPPAAAQRPPREPDPALPVAARLRGEPGAADRVRRDDRARDRAGGLAAGDGPAGAAPTSAGTCPAPTSHPASASGSWRGTPWWGRRPRRPASLAAACRPHTALHGPGRSRPPRLRTLLRSPGPSPPASTYPTRRWRGGVPDAATRTTWSRGRSGRGSRPAPRGREIPDTWCCPDCGVRDKVDFVAVEHERCFLDWRRDHRRLADHARAGGRGGGGADSRGGLGRRHDGQARRPGRVSRGRRSTTRSGRSRSWPRRWSSPSSRSSWRWSTRRSTSSRANLVEAIRGASRGVLELARRNALLQAVVSASYGAETELLPLLTTPQRRAGADRDRGGAAAGHGVPDRPRRPPPRRGHRHGRAAGAVARRPPDREARRHRRRHRLDLGADAAPVTSAARRIVTA